MQRQGRAILIRSGGLGDFVLALPFLRAMRQRYVHVCLVTRPGYAELIREDRLVDAAIDVDGAVFATLWSEPAPELRTALAGADVFSALPDADGAMKTRLVATGAARVVLLDSRPASPPHIVERFFLAAGWPVPPGLMGEATLAGNAPAGDALWIHPGSGSPAKNAPSAWLAAQARRWLAAHGGRLIVSFGEADGALREPIRAAFAGLPCQWVITPTLPVLRRRLANEAAAFLGNDSGVTHLAAALGLPANVIFRHTDPAIWRPLGPAVRLVRLDHGEDTAWDMLPER